MKIHTYNVTTWPFVEELLHTFRAYLNKNCTLETLHEYLEEEYDIFDENTDQSTVLHRIHYENQDDVFLDIYKDFIRDVVRPMFNEPIVYQKIPTFRVHLPGNLGVGSYHRDRDFNHGREEINFIVACTRMYDTNTVWIESEEGKEDFKPITLDVGGMVEFDGANLLHGNKTNTTDQTRVSFDFRVVPLSKFQNRDDESITNPTKFKIGEYFEVCK